MIIAAFRKGDTVTCRILIDDIQQAQAVTTGIGDIANCSADVK